MSDATPDYAKIPILGGTVREVQGILPHEAALQQATEALLMAGFDRADLSVPTAPSEATTSMTQATESPADNNDARNVRTNINGTIGATGALIAGTVASVATGGAMLPVAAATIAAGVGAGGLSHLGFQAAADSREAGHDQKGREGQLVLAAIVRDADKEKSATNILQEAGATQVETVERTGSEARFT
jgi:hypothetical protein